jgi:two-component system chemotaxis response regulator CheY
MIVLAVDDDPASLMITRSAMRALGHECVCAASGEDAWRSFLVRRPDVIVSDWSMPGMSGLELCRRIRALESDEYTYFILVTGHGTSQEVRVGMDAGVDEYLVKPVRLGDLEARMIAAGRVTSLLRHLSRQRVELEGLNSQLRSAASLDPLTGLGNRRALEHDLVVLEARVLRYRHSYCMGLVDVDSFKSFNDAYGHQAGDRALQAVAFQLRTQARTGDSLYRYGGDELLCIFPEQSIANSRIAIERMLTGVEELAIPHAAAPRGILTFSAGLARMDPDLPRQVPDVLKEADDSLYLGKRQGRNRISHAAAS